MKHIKKLSFAKILRNVLLGSLVASKATATVFSAGVWVAQDTAWQNFRRQSDGNQDVSDLQARLFAMVEQVTDPRNLTNLIRTSYEVTLLADYPSLDRFWMQILTERGDAASLTELMEIRSSTMETGSMDRQAYLENWLYLAHHDGGHYDCGGGNGGNEATPGCD
jgi:hypothetical protein